MASNTRDRDTLLAAMREFLPPNQHHHDLNKVQNAMVDYVLRRTENLETLVLRDASVHFPLVESVGGKSRPVPYIAHSLKRIHTSMSRSYPTSARMVVWMMSFCPTLYEASFNFTITTRDFKFLELHSEGFKGKSNVRKLAISPGFQDNYKYWVPKNLDDDIHDKKLEAGRSVHLQNEKMRSSPVAKEEDEVIFKDRRLLSLTSPSFVLFTFPVLYSKLPRSSPVLKSGVLIFLIWLKAFTMPFFLTIV